MPTDELKALLERVRAARSPDRDLDGDLSLALGLPQAFFAQFKTDTDGEPFDPDLNGSDIDGPGCYPGPTWGGGGRSWTAPHLTTSIDAALALVERALPDWRWLVHGPRLGLPYEASLTDADRSRRVVVGQHTVNGALALVSAVLSALIAEPARHG